MKIRNINPLGDVRVAALGMQLVKVGEVVDVPDEVAAVLVIQTLNWELADKAPKADQEAVAKIIAEHLAELAAASGVTLPDAPPSAPEPIQTEQNEEA